MKFIVDEQLPPVLAAWIERQGHEASHICAAGVRAIPDRAIWSLALDTGAVIVSKDEDFAGRRKRGGDGPQVLWLRVGNTASSHLLHRVAAVWPEAVRLLEAGEAIVEVR